MGATLFAVHELLIVVASLVVKHRLQGTSASVVAAPRLRNTGSVVVAGLVDPWHVGFSKIRNQTRVSHIGRWILYR